MDQNIKEFISEARIQQRVKELAAELTERFRDEDPVFVPVLKGSLMFCSDLLKNLDFPLELEFIQASSYKDATVSSGNVEMREEPFDVSGRSVVVLEDIVDTGRTISRVSERLKEMGAKEVTTVALLDKPERRVIDFRPDYSGFVIEDKYVVGYGMDIAEKGRNLPYIGVLDIKN